MASDLQVFKTEDKDAISNALEVLKKKGVEARVCIYFLKGSNKTFTAVGSNRSEVEAHVKQSSGTPDSSALHCFNNP